MMEALPVTRRAMASLVYSFMVIITNCRLAVPYRLIEVYENTCKSYYYADDQIEFHVEYKGDSFTDSQCYIKFINHSSFTRTLCVEPLELQMLQISCGTVLEYDRNFLSEYLYAKKMTCNDISYETWCGGTRTGNLYIVFNKAAQQVTNEYVKLRVYVKDLPDSNPTSRSEWSNTTSDVSAAIIIPVVLFVVILVTVILVFCLKYQQRQRQANRPSYSFQTTAVQAIPMQPTSSRQMGYSSVPQNSVFPPAPEGYTLHPIQSNLPVPAHAGNQSRTSPRNSARLTPRQSPRNSPRSSPVSSDHDVLRSTGYLSDPSLADAPPSYESVVGR